MEPIGYKINVLSKLFFETIKQKIISQGINVTQFHIVKFLDCNNESEITQMENENLIIRQKAKDDSRKTLIYLTNQGKKLSEKCRSIFKEVDELMESSLNSEELKIFNECIDKMKNKLEEVNNNA